MTREATGAAPERTAIRRARELLTPEASRGAGSRPALEAGYLDLLGGDLESTGAAQDLMTGRLVPAIYERYWRPALARAAKGITGPGMAEELRIARLLLGLGRSDAVLDVACGPGNFSREFARAVGSDGLVVGVDASRTMLERASGMRIFEGDEIVEALEARGFTGARRRLSGMVQFVGARLPAG